MAQIDDVSAHFPMFVSQGPLAIVGIQLFSWRAAFRGQALQVILVFNIRLTHGKNATPAFFLGNFAKRTKKSITIITSFSTLSNPTNWNWKTVGPNPQSLFSKSIWRGRILRIQEWILVKTKNHNPVQDHFLSIDWTKTPSNESATNWIVENEISSHLVSKMSKRFLVKNLFKNSSSKLKCKQKLS